MTANALADLGMWFNIGRGRDGRWHWRAKAPGLAEFCRIERPGWILMENGFVYVGPFNTEEAAVNDQVGFINAYSTFVKTQRPIIHASDEASATK